MDRRTVGLLVGTMSLLGVGLVLSVAYPFAPTEPHGTNPPDERFTLGDAAGFRATGSIVVDGETLLAFDGVVTPDGERYQSVEEVGVRTEEYRATPNGTVYRRLTVEGEDAAERTRNRIAADGDIELLDADTAGSNTTFVVETDSTELADGISGTAMVFVRSLDVTGYDDRGTRGGVDVYEPRNGWYGGEAPYRITHASGEVRTEPGTLAVESANVSWAVTDPAGSYAVYALVRLASSDPRTYEIAFDFDEGRPGFDRPRWTEDMDSGS